MSYLSISNRSLSVSPFFRRVVGAWRKLSGPQGLRLLQGGSRRLQVQETVQLGERRFVSILRVDGQQFLIGGSTSQISLLAELPAEAQPSFGAVLRSQGQQEQSA